MYTLKSQLIKLGSERKDLRPHLRPLLAALQGSWVVKVFENEDVINSRKGEDLEDVLVEVLKRERRTLELLLWDSYLSDGMLRFLARDDIYADPYNSDPWDSDNFMEYEIRIEHDGPISREDRKEAERLVSKWLQPVASQSGRTPRRL